MEEGELFCCRPVGRHFESEFHLFVSSAGGSLGEFGRDLSNTTVARWRDELSSFSKIHCFAAAKLPLKVDELSCVWLYTHLAAATCWQTSFQQS